MDTLELLTLTFGPMMNSRDVQKALRFRTPDGLRTARSKGRLKLEMFPMQGRRGLFARTADVAHLIETALDPKEGVAM